MRNFSTIFHNGYFILHYHQQYSKVSFIQHSCQHSLSVVVLIKTILMDARWYLIALIVLICIFLMSNDVEHLLMYLLVFYMSSLGTCLFRSFAYYKKGLFDFLGLRVCDFHIYISYINPFQIYFRKYFHPFHSLYFHFIISFVLQKLFNLM